MPRLLGQDGGVRVLMGAEGGGEMMGKYDAVVKEISLSFFF